MMTRVQTTEGFPHDIHNSQSPSQSLCHIQPTWSCPLSQRRFRPIVIFHHSETFTSPCLYHSEVLIPQGLLHSKTLSILKASALNMKLQ